MILKSDQEPSITELKECIRRERGDNTMTEESPAYDSRSNGDVERAILTVQGRVRTVKDAFERRYAYELRPEDHIVPWMAQHAAAIINRFHKSSDGLTAFRRVRGKGLQRIHM